MIPFDRARGCTSTEQYHLLNLLIPTGRVELRVMAALPGVFVLRLTIPESLLHVNLEAVISKRRNHQWDPVCDKQRLFSSRISTVITLPL